MGQITLPGKPPVAITLKSSARARRLSLRVSQLDGRVTLTMPRGLPRREAIAFAQEREGWIRGHLVRIGDGEVPAFGRTLPIEGAPVMLLPGSARAPERQGNALVLPDRPDRVPAMARAYLKALARDRLAAASDRHAGALGRTYAKLTLRDTRSRWGSCTVDGNLMYSWRLIMAPPEVLDYVAAHEVAHLAEHNHSPAFWAVCARLCPDHKRLRAWLRAEGAALHRYRFD